MFENIKMDEDTADAALIGGFKGSKLKPVSLMLMARAIRFKTEKLGTYEAVAKQYNVSKTLVAQFDKLNNLHKDVQRLVDQNKLGLDQGYRISFLSKEKHLEVAKVCQNLNAVDTRHLIEFLKKNPAVPVLEAKERLLKAKSIVEKMHLVIVPLPEDVHKAVSEAAKSHKMTVEEYIMRAIQGALKGRST